MLKKITDLDLEAFLQHKSLYYDKIDFSVVQNAYETLKSHLNLPYVIHIVGTNGKGTTGRFLAHCLYENGQDVLHYTSPHIQRFNERIWINGNDVSDESLEQTHAKLKRYLSTDILEKLTYFEYTTLLALLLSSNRDYVILEAGLGGEFDATNVVKNDMSLITTIGLDHMNFLGNSIESIAKTKMRSCDTLMLLGHQEEKEVLEYAQSICEERHIELRTFKEYDLTALEYPCYLKRNLALSLTALEYLGFNVDLKVLSTIQFKGRFETILPNVIVDVGHNPLAAEQIAKELKKSNAKKVLIYNAYEDKDYETVLSILKPCIKEVQILPIEDNRMVSMHALKKVCDNLNIIHLTFKGIIPDENYLVFGSFLVVEQILTYIKENKIDEK